MEVVFIRHAESENNLLHTRLRAELSPDIAKADALFHHQRQHDPRLTPLGQQQSLLVANRIATECPHSNEVWVSFLSRALETAAAIHSKLPKANVVVMQDINECGGSYRFDAGRNQFVPEPGTSRAAVRQQYPTFAFYNHTSSSSANCDAGDETRGWYAGTGKEPPEDAMRRAVGLIARLEARAASCSDDRQPPLLVVTHGDFFKLIVRVLESSRGLVVEQPAAGRTPTDKSDDTDDGVLLDKKPSDTWIPNTSVTRFLLTKDNAAQGSAWSWAAPLFGDASHLEQGPRDV